MTEKISKQTLYGLHFTCFETKFEMFFFIQTDTKKFELYVYLIDSMKISFTEIGQ